jgi:hypothetical protein
MPRQPRKTTRCMPQRGSPEAAVRPSKFINVTSHSADAELQHPNGRVRML